MRGETYSKSLISSSYDSTCQPYRLRLRLWSGSHEKVASRRQRMASTFNRCMKTSPSTALIMRVGLEKWLVCFEFCCSKGMAKFTRVSKRFWLTAFAWTPQMCCVGYIQNGRLLIHHNYHNCQHLPPMNFTTSIENDHATHFSLRVGRGRARGH